MTTRALLADVGGRRPGRLWPERLSAPLTWEQLAGQGEGSVDALDALMSYSFCERLQGISMPVLFVLGENDMLIPVGDAHRSSA